ncbi:MAG: TonB C-terminal domain-containing protein [Sulfurovaceae bacterium]
MTEHRSWVSAVAAICIYLLTLFSLIYYFNHHESDEAKNYVKKDQKKISVSLNSPQPKVEPKPKEQPKPKKEEPKPKKETPKVVDTNDLFKDVKTDKKPENKEVKKPNIIEVSEPKEVKQEPKKSAMDRLKEAQESEEDFQSGIEDAYIAKVKERLSQWGEQGEFKGETANVEFVIKPTGDFTFRLKGGSNNQAFNEGLIQYLESLQKVGLGAHSAPRSLVIDVKFIAKE